MTGEIDLRLREKPKGFVADTIVVRTAVVTVYCRMCCIEFFVLSTAVGAVLPIVVDGDTIDEVVHSVV